MIKVIVGALAMILVSGCAQEPTLEKVYRTSVFDDVVRGMVFYKGVTDNSETSIENLYVEGFINTLTARNFKELTHCQNLDGINIRMVQIDDFEVEVNTVKCQGVHKSKGKVLSLSEDGRKISVVEINA